MPILAPLLGLVLLTVRVVLEGVRPTQSDQLLEEPVVLDGGVVFADLGDVSCNGPHDRVQM